MITKKLEETIRRMNVLVGKSVAGTLTDAERGEMAKLQKSVEAATTPPPVAKTRPATMTVEEFTKHIDAELAEMEKAPDEERLALLQANIEAVKVQGKTAPTDVVAVLVRVQSEKADDCATQVAALQAQVADLTARLEMQEKKATVKTEEAPAAPPADDTPIAKLVKEGVSAQIALEALDALISKVNSVKDLVASGNATAESVEKTFEGWWNLMDAIRTHSAIAAAAKVPAETPPPAKSDDAAPPAPPVEKTAEEMEKDLMGDKGWSGDLSGPRMSPEEMRQHFVRKGAERKAKE